MKTNTVKVEDLKVEMIIAFKNFNDMDVGVFNIKPDTPYKVIKERLYDGAIELDVGDERGYIFPIYTSENPDIYIWDKQNDLSTVGNDIHLEGSVTFTPAQDIKLLDRTIGTLEILAKYYESIPSELILELIAMNKTELVIK